MRAASLSAVLIACCGLFGCGSLDRDEIAEGKFSGKLFVMWVGEGKFLFAPDPDAPLTYEWMDSAGKTWAIRPEMMYTDGGSIPKIGQIFKGMGPWGYAPAYVIHDWLYVARYCNTDGHASPAQIKLADMKFKTSGEIMAAAIQSLIETKRVEANDVAPWVISSAVSGPYAEALWNQRGVCKGREVDEDHRRAAEETIAGSSQPLARRKRLEEKARVVSAFEF